MLEHFEKDFSSFDLEETKIENPTETQEGTAVPSIEDFKEKLQEIFGMDGGESCAENMVPAMGDFCDERDEKVILEDGTTVQLPVTNSESVEIEGDYKTDDNGKIYIKDGNLEPSSSYELNGSIYTTDEQGRIIKCKAEPERSPENPRDIDAQRQAGGEDRREGDQGGHIIGRDLNGDGGAGNLLAMDSRINQSDYKRMENDIKASLDEGKKVTVDAEMTYSDDSKRPDRITVTVTADEEKTIYKFDNNLDGSLMNDVPDEGKDVVQSRVDDLGGQISSIKEEYDKEGNLLKTTVYITYVDENGDNCRTRVEIPNTQGGD